MNQMPVPTDEQKARHERLQLTAEQMPNAPRCIQGEAVYMASAPFGFGPGHIYSPAGMDEFKITHLCEWHFDQFAYSQYDDDDDPMMMRHPEGMGFVPCPMEGTNVEINMVSSYQGKSTSWLACGCQITLDTEAFWEAGA